MDFTGFGVNEVNGDRGWAPQTPSSHAPRPSSALASLQRALALAGPLETPDSPGLPETPSPAPDEADLGEANLAATGQAPLAVGVASVPSGDPSLALSGLPPGATAALMGGGWAVNFPGNDEATSAELATFHFKTGTVAAVSASAPMGPSADLPHRSPEGEAALAAYLHQTPTHHSLLDTRNSQVDVLD